MGRRILLSIAIYLVLSFPVAARAGNAAELDLAAGYLRERILLSAPPGGVVCRAELLCGSALLPSIYIGRAFQPLWTTAQGPTRPAWELAAALRESRWEGLQPSDYHLTPIESLLEGLSGGVAGHAGQIADLDLLLTDAFLLYGSHLLAGRVNPETIHSEWSIRGRVADLAAILTETEQDISVRESLDRLRPRHPGYRRLQAALADYERLRLRGGWARVPDGKTLRHDDRGRRVAAVRRRLAVTDDLPLRTEDVERFDRRLEEGVRRYQARHGLVVDGIVGKATLAALNVPVEDRSAALRINLERWRWLPLDFGDHYILVNAADFTLNVVEEGRVVLSMKVIVGKEYRKTPVFTGRMTYLVFNPFWNIPPRIAAEDILPRIKEDPLYLDRQGIRVFAGWQAGAAEIAPADVDWSGIDPEHFPFKLRQDPGPRNALGTVKFLFPNKFDVYLHDTASRELFGRVKRDFSSGCIRIQHPVDLAEHLLEDADDWDRERIMEALDSGERLTVTLQRPVPVHLLYWTAWVAEDGAVHFRDDVYDRDRPLAAALAEPPPKPGDRP